MEKAFLEEHLAAGRPLEQIGRVAGKHASTVGYWVRKHGLSAVGREKHAPRGGLAKERLAEFVARGMSVREIARECSVSYTTARHWLRRHGLATRRAQPRVGNPRPGRLDRRCSKHGRTEFVLEGRGYYRCCRCRAERVAERRRRLKRILVEEAGGACAVCGYDRHPAALEFHHLRPEEKCFELARRGATRSLEVLRKEARKCALLCSNCHALVEVGVVAAPMKS